MSAVSASLFNVYKLPCLLLLARIRPIARSFIAKLESENSHIHALSLVNLEIETNFFFVFLEPQEHHLV